MRPRKPDKPESRENPADCRRTALDLLARREHGRRELAAKLRQRGFEPPLIESVLDALAEERLLDDRRFAESFVRTRVGRGQGPLRIRAELAARGVEALHIEQSLAEADVDWPALAEQVRRRRFGAESPDQAAEWSRQARFLSYRGFTNEQIRRALGDLGG